jgi:hypothetical protein
MDTQIPTAEQVRSALAGLGYTQVQELARLSGVPFTTLWNIRKGGPKVGGKGTDNPGIETVRMFMPFINELKKSALAGAAPEKGEHAAASVYKRRDDETTRALKRAIRGDHANGNRER